jgi:hypothetical protein
VEFDHNKLQAQDRLKRYYREAEHARTIAALKLEIPKQNIDLSKIILKFFRVLQLLRFSSRDSRGGENV